MLYLFSKKGLAIFNDFFRCFSSHVVCRWTCTCICIMFFVVARFMNWIIKGTFKYKELVRILMVNKLVYQEKIKKINKIELETLMIINTANF